MHAIDTATQNMASHSFSESSNNDYQKGWSTSEKAAYDHYETAAENFSKTHNIDKSVTLSMFSRISAGIPDFSSISPSIGGEYSGNKSLGDVYNHAKNYGKSNNLTNEASIIAEAVSSHGFSESDTRSQNIQNSVGDSLKEANSYESQSRAYLDKAHSLRNEAQYVSSNSLAVEKDVVNSMVNWGAKERDIYGHELGHERVMRMLSSTDEYDKGNAERLIQNYFAKHDVQGMVHGSYIGAKSSVGVGNITNSYNKFKDTLDAGVGEISNDNRGAIGFSNQHIKDNLPADKAKAEAQLNAVTFDTTPKEQVMNQRHGDIIDVLHYTEAGNPKETKN
jgi:hypothetical protein